MTRAYTVSTLKSRIRARCDQAGSKFITDDELLDYIDSAACELYDILVTQFKDYFIEFTTFNTVVGTNIYSLPANFYKLRAVDQIYNGESEDVPSMPFEDRNLYLKTTYQQVPNSNLHYCIVGETLMLLPTPTVVSSITMWYVPIMPKLNSDSQLVSGFSGWEEVLINEVCARIAIKAEEDPAPYYRAKEKVIERIENAARQRDVGSPDSVIDVTGVTKTVYY